MTVCERKKIKIGVSRIVNMVEGDSALQRAAEASRGLLRQIVPQRKSQRNCFEYISRPGLAVSLVFFLMFVK